MITEIVVQKYCTIIKKRAVWKKKEHFIMRRKKTFNHVTIFLSDVAKSVVLILMVNVIIFCI
jgi:hypothetical protein